MLEKTWQKIEFKGEKELVIRIFEKGEFPQNASKNEPGSGNAS